MLRIMARRWAPVGSGTAPRGDVLLADLVRGASDLGPPIQTINGFLTAHSPFPTLAKDYDIPSWFLFDTATKQALTPHHRFLDDHPELGRLNHQLQLLSQIDRLRVKGVCTLQEYGVKRAALTDFPKDFLGFLDAEHHRMLEAAEVRRMLEEAERRRTLEEAERQRMLEAAERRRMLLEWWEEEVLIPATSSKPAHVLVTELKRFQLTHRHNYGSAAKPLYMLGKWRQQCVENFVSTVQAGFGSDRKELWPIHYVVAAPRQGKSLLLDEIARRVELECRRRVIAITFNSRSPLETTPMFSTVAEVLCEFWGRVVYAVYKMVHAAARPAVEPMPFDTFRSKPFFGVIDFAAARGIAADLGLGAPLIVADEFSKLTDRMEQLSSDDRQKAMSGITTLYSGDWRLLCSGFKVEDPDVLATASGRPTEVIALPPLSRATRPEFGAMQAAVKAAGGGTLPPALRQLYEVVKNVPGYFGLWVELLDENRRVRSLDDLNPPIVPVMRIEARRDPRLFSGYWRAVANHDATSPVFTKLERLGVLLHSPGCAFPGYLSPLLFTHGQMSSLYEHKLIRAAMDAFSVEPWTPEAKGNALEKLLEVALVLRAAYTNDGDSAGRVTLGQLIASICGREAHVLLAPNAPAETGVVSFPALGGAIGLETVVGFGSPRAFPATWVGESTDAGCGYASRDKQEQRRLENESMLRSPNVSVVRMTAKYNAGCDRALVARSSDGGLVLFLFEVRYHGRDGGGGAVSDGSNVISRKAMHALSACEQYLGGDVKIQRVCFVYCTAALDVAPANAYDLGHALRDETLGGVMEKLRARGCSSSLHVVGTEEHWRSLLMESLYLVVPDMDEEAVSDHRAHKGVI